MKLNSLSVLLFCCLLASPAISEEIVVESVDLPGASLEQEITYSTSKKDYEKARDKKLARLRAGDQSAYSNPIDGPYMIVETTAKIGVAYKGIGTSSGRKHLRRVTAAEDALYRYESER